LGAAELQHGGWGGGGGGVSGEQQRGVRRSAGLAPRRKGATRAVAALQLPPWLNAAARDGGVTSGDDQETYAGADGGVAAHGDGDGGERSRWGRDDGGRRRVVDGLGGRRGRASGAARDAPRSLSAKSPARRGIQERGGAGSSDGDDSSGRSDDGSDAARKEGAALHSRRPRPGRQRQEERSPPLRQRKMCSSSTNTGGALLGPVTAFAATQTVDWAPAVERLRTEAEELRGQLARVAGAPLGGHDASQPPTHSSMRATMASCSLREPGFRTTCDWKLAAVTSQQRSVHIRRHTLRCNQHARARRRAGGEPCRSGAAAPADARCGPRRRGGGAPQSGGELRGGFLRGAARPGACRGGGRGGCGGAGAGQGAGGRAGGEQGGAARGAGGGGQVGGSCISRGPLPGVALAIQTLLRVCCLPGLVTPAPAFSPPLSTPCTRPYVKR
jgi:hypothetical protein